MSRITIDPGGMHFDVIKQRDQDLNEDHVTA